MKTLFILVSVMVLLFLTAHYEIDAQEKKPITNADIIKMVKADVPESNIVKAIQQSITNFDTSPQGLIDLNKQGVSSKIIDAMQQAGAPTTSVQTATQPQTNTPLSNQQTLNNAWGMVGVVCIDATGRKEMKIAQEESHSPIAGPMDLNPFGSRKTTDVFNGKRARFRTTTTSPYL